MNKANPYENVPVEKWGEVTKELVEQHPLRPFITLLYEA